MNALDRKAYEDDDEGDLVLEQYFAIVPEWVLDADISDAALRLYAVLLRYGQTSGHRMPGRRLLASRLHKRSTDSVDCALKELVGVGAVVVQHRREGPVNLTNRYVLSTPPHRCRVLPVDEGAAAAPEGAIAAPFRADSSEAAPSRGAAHLRPPLAARMRPPWPHI